MGIAETVPNGRVVGVDINRGNLAVALRDAATIGRGNLGFAAADGRQLPFRDNAFDAVLCHSMLETLLDPASVLVELRRIIKRGGVIGAASVEYGGIIFGGTETVGPQRFYDIRQQLWRAEGIADPNAGRHLRGLFRPAAMHSTISAVSSALLSSLKKQQGASHKWHPRRMMREAWGNWPPNASPNASPPCTTSSKFCAGR